ncbi:MAG: hypothetical protein J6C82_00260 [Clostridia bacterium]|nr:hypothetical protein [Clostridia bacterium]
MKKLNKVLSTIIALAISASQLVCVNAAEATTHGDVYAMYPTAESTKSGHDLSLQGGLVNDAWRIADLQYDANVDAVLSKNIGAKRTPLTYKPTSAIDRSKYNYAAILQKHVLYAGTDSIHWTIHTDFQNTFEAKYTENPVWEKTVMDIEGETSNWKTFDQWIVGFDNEPSAVTSDNYTKYIAFFETEADANAYDLSIKGYSINGIPGEVDNIAHTITFDMGGQTADVFAGAAPVITSDPLATITTTSEINYVDNITYNVTNVLGEELTYVVKFTNYDAEDTAPEGAYIFKFDTAAKVATTTLKQYAYDVEGTFDPQPSFDSNEKALNIRVAYGHGNGFVIDEEVPEIGKYKYAKLRYKYIDGTASATNDYSNAISLTETDGRGKFIRQHMGLEIMNGRISDRRWFTDVVDISDLSKTANSDSRVRFNCCVNESGNGSYGTTLLVDYIALFETYEDAVNYESDTAFEAPEINAVDKTTMTASMTYTEDRANPKLMLAMYKDGKLIETAMSGDITYEMDFTPISETWIPYMGASTWILNNEMVTELTTAEIDVADYEDGTYTAKILMLGGTESIKPYFAAEEYTVTVATRNEVKQFKAEKVTE